MSRGLFSHKTANQVQSVNADEFPVSTSHECATGDRPPRHRKPTASRRFFPAGRINIILRLAERSLQSYLLSVSLDGGIFFRLLWGKTKNSSWPHGSKAEAIPLLTQVFDKVPSPCARHPGQLLGPSANQRHKKSAPLRANNNRPRSPRKPIHPPDIWLGSIRAAQPCFLPGLKRKRRSGLFSPPREKRLCRTTGR
jgi:hypothetical protein